MNSYPFKKLDAFATPTSNGNPAAVVDLTGIDGITDSLMQRIATELKGFVSEAAFIKRIAPDAFDVRYFSSEKEVQFCGHATICLAYDRFINDPSLAGLSRIFLHTNMGVLPVENRIQEEDSVYIYAPMPAYTECNTGLPEICTALNLSESAVDPSIPLGIVNAGNQTLCLPLRSLGDVVGVRPDFQVLLDFCQSHQLDVITVFSQDVANPTHRLRTRVFAAPFGYLEDPATGSGNAALGYHLFRSGHWDGKPIRIEQNADVLNPNIVRLASVPDAEAGVRVIFGGSAILRIEGQYWA